MKRLLLFCLLCLVPVTGKAQGLSTSNAVQSVPTLTATCTYQVNGRVSEVIKTGTSAGLYTCGVDGLWHGPYPTSSTGGTVTDVTGTSPISVATGTTTPVISCPTCVTSAAPINATYVTETPSSGLSSEFALSTLATGILKNTTTTGVPSIAVAGDFPTLNQNTTGTAANLSGTPTLPNGTAATTQSQADNSTKLATTAYVDTGLGTKQATITFGTGVQTALGVNVGSAGAPVLFNGALGTPSSGTGTNITGIPAANILAGTFGAGNYVVSGGSFGLSGAISGAGIFGTSGIRYKNVASTLTDTISSGTVATNYTNVFGNNTLAATNATTITNAFNTYIADPVQGTNVTLSNKWALGADSMKIGTSNQVTIGNTGIIAATSPRFTTGIDDANGNQMFKFTATASAVDGFTFINAATASPATVEMQATGSDSNINLKLTPKGSGEIFVGTQSINSSIANTMYIKPSAGQGLILYTTGSAGVALQNGLLQVGTDGTWFTRNAAGVMQFGTASNNASGSWLATNGTASGDLFVTGAQITPASGTGITVNNAGSLRVLTYKATFTSAAFSAAAKTADVTIGTLPAKTIVQGVYADVTQTFSGGGETAATMTCGITAGGSEYLVSFDAFTATIQRGLVDGDLGTSINRANAVQGGNLPSWSGTTTVQCRLTTTTNNTSALTQGSVTFYLITRKLP